jgi:TetR/AcrR family transcriptional regulator, transcriptional repressor for nem operon
MPRPRSYKRDDVVEDAKNTFWEKGFRGTSISDLERGTGLNRSSLYLALGAKRKLFAAAMDRYLEDFIGPLVGRMEGTPASPGDVVAFFSGVRDALLEDPKASRHGCLMVNTIAELSGRERQVTRWGAEYRDHLRAAFAHALQGEGGNPEDDALVDRHGSMLAAATRGVWLSARSDPTDAAPICDEIIAEVESWSST